MLYLIGLGLGDATDITVKGLQAVKSCSRVYLEAYTSILTVGKEALEEYFGKQLILADRDLVEQGADEILKDADVTDVAFLVVGDPFGATTHSDLVLRAVNAGIPYKVIHNASIMNAVGCCGLQVSIHWESVQSAPAVGGKPPHQNPSRIRLLLDSSGQSCITSARLFRWCFGQKRGDLKVSTTKSVKTEQLDCTRSAF
ncbi:diphthine synthase [Goodea atripinnis]|uniref:diphthine methyl ester synthase n=1 Tax=Goodea atripinnis TaxID=208336 RepID=A0ABV0MFY5_9TELE